MMDPTIHTLQSMEKSLLEMCGALHEVITSLKPSYNQITARVSAKPSYAPLRSEIHSKNLVLARITALRRNSSSSSPYYFKCGEAGHFASSCHNVTLCFACIGFRQKSFHYKQYRVKAISQTPPPLLPLNSTPKPDPSLTHPQISMDRSRMPVPRFFSLEASVNLDNTFENSLVLEDTTGIGRVHIETTLHHQMPQFQWVTRIFDDSRYLIEAPNTRWLQQTAARGVLRIENIDLPVQR
jgi:hypothetical protein